MTRALAVLAVAVAACEPARAPAVTTDDGGPRDAAPTPVFSPLVDASRRLDVSEEVYPPSCDEWCRRAAVLRCMEGTPTEDGASCVEVCRNIQSGPARLNLKCRVAARSCQAAESCER